MSRIGAALLLGLCACATTSPQPSAYLLAPAHVEEGVTAHEAYDLALGRLALPAYLQREGIVIETSEQRLHEAREHLWAEPLPAALRRLLQHDLTAASGHAVAADVASAPDAALVVDLTIEQFHGTVDGRVTLAAEWVIEGPGDATGPYHFVRRAPTAAAGYAALVAAHRRLVGELARSIAESLPPLP